MLGNDEQIDDIEEQDEEYYDTVDDEQNVQNKQQQQHLQHQQQQKQSSQQQQHSSFSGSGSNQGFRHYQRMRRDASDVSDSELESKLKCSRTECANVRCVVSNLEKDQSAWIALRMRLVTQTLNSVSDNAFLSKHFQYYSEIFAVMVNCVNSISNRSLQIFH